MHSKSLKKKQAASRHHVDITTRVLITIQASLSLSLSSQSNNYCFKSIDSDDNEDDDRNSNPTAQILAIAVDALLHQLHQADCIQSQVKAIQSSKTPIRRGIQQLLLIESSPHPMKTSSSSMLTQCIRVLLELYVYPTYSPLKASMEWFISFLVEPMHKDSLCLIVQHKCVSLWHELQSTSNLDKEEDRSFFCDIDKIYEYISTFNCIALLDSYFHWMDMTDPLDDDGGHGEASLSVDFLIHLARIYAYCVDNVVDQEKRMQTSAAKALRCLDCCTESMKTIMSVMKERSRREAKKREPSRWMTLSEYVLHSCSQLLKSPYIINNKDIVTSTCMGVVCTIWTIRMIIMDGGDYTSEQEQRTRRVDHLVGVLSLLSISGPDISIDSFHTQSRGEEEEEIRHSKLTSPIIDIIDMKEAVRHLCISSIDMHPVLMDLAQSTSLMIKCGVLRAYMSTAEDEYLLHPLLPVPTEQDSSTADITNITYCHVAIRQMIQSNSMQLFIDQQQSSSSSSGLELLFYPFFVFIMHAIKHPTPLFQFYALQTLEAWLARIQSISTIVSMSMYEKKLSKLFRIISSVLTKLWIHPVKQINHLVPSIYMKLIQTITHVSKSAIAMSDNHHVSDGGDANGNGDADDGGRTTILPDLLREVLRMPVRHRGKYQALNALLPHIEAKACFLIQSDFMDSLIAAIEHRDIASSVSGFLGTLLTQLYIIDDVGGDDDDDRHHRLDNDNATVRMMWLPAVCSGLCSTNRKLRLYIADYLLKELFRVDRLCVPAMLQYIRDHIYRKGEGSDRQLIDGSHQLWGIMNVILHARLLGMSGVETVLEESRVGDSSSSSSGVVTVTANEFILSCISADSELRLVSLTALIATSRTAAAMDRVDLDILKRCLRYSLKSTDADHCNKVTRIVKALITRVRESARVAQRDLKKIDKQLKHLEGHSKQSISISDTGQTTNRWCYAVVDGIEARTNNDEQHKVSLVTSSVADVVTASDKDLSSTNDTTAVAATAVRYRGIIKDSFDVLLWLKTELLGNLYPGSVSDREVIALELLNTIIDSMGVGAEQLKPLFDAHMVRILITMLESSWDRSRRSAADILLKFPRPLSGFTTAIDARGLLSKSITLACSAKLRESDAGALMIRNLYLIYCMSLRWDVRLHHPEGKEGMEILLQLFRACQAEDSKECCCALFINELCDTWSSTLTKLSEVFSSLQSSSSSQHYSSTIITHSSSTMDHSSTTPTPSSSAPLSSPSSSSSGTSFPLCHGLLASIRYCLLETHKAGMMTGTMDSPSSSSSSTTAATTTMHRMDDVWRPILHRILEACFASLTLSMTIVAEAGDKTDISIEEDSALPSDMGGSSVMTSKGPAMSSSLTAAGISASSGRINMSASYVNTNSSMMGGKSCDDSSGDGFDEESASSQRVVVAAWLLVKETTALLACLVSISAEVMMHASSSSKMIIPSSPSLPTGSVRIDDSAPLLSLKDLSLIGSTILDALGRLKHMGAIFEAQVALQTISSTLLK